ncbi:amidohydrolase family protein [Streptomyces sp. NPDC002623]
MAASGVDVQILSLSKPGVEVIEDPAEAVTAARRVNDHLAKAIAERPTRFAGFATLPLQDPKAAVVELRRMVEELGFKGVLHNDHVLGHYLDEPQFWPVWVELERLGVTLYLHPPAVPADNWRVFEG